jgi:hypothetical protein
MEVLGAIDTIEDVEKGFAYHCWWWWYEEEVEEGRNIRTRGTS